MSSTWSDIRPGYNVKFEVAVGSKVFTPVFHVANVETTQIRTHDFGSHLTVAATSSWTEITDTGGTRSMLEPENQNYMYDIKIGVSPSPFVIHMKWPEDTFYGTLHGIGSETGVYGGTLGVNSSWHDPTMQLFNIYENGHPTFKMYNTSLSTLTATARITIDKLNTVYLGISRRPDEWIEKNTGIPLVTVSLGGLRQMPAPSWLITKLSTSDRGI